MSIRSKNYQSRAFTIVELLIVIVVIAILAAISIVAYNGIQQRARVSAANSALSQATKKIALAQVDTAGTIPTCAEFKSIITGSVLDPADTCAPLNINDTNYQYKTTPTNVSPSTGYCITVTKGSTSQYITNTGAPTSGSCLGHGTGGVDAITNLIPNPSFESNTNGWTDNGGRPIALSTIGISSGTKSLSTTNNSGGLYSLFPRLVAGTPATPGEIFTATGTVRAEGVAQSNINIRLDWLNSSDGGISASSGSVTSLSVGGSALVKVTGTAPAGTASVRVGLISSNVANGAVLHIDSILLTRSSVQYNYADGNSLNWDWNGATNNSTSTGPPL